MPSPFPGMDPYLEDPAIWPVFHHQLVMCLYQVLLTELVNRYRARVCQRQYVTEQALFTSVLREEHHEDYLEIRTRNDGRLVTLLDVVSPCNKLTREGREAYLAKRKEGRAANANLVELDLILQGQPMLDYARDGLPDWDHLITVTRSTQPERYEIYTTTLQKPLPSFKLPLAPDDKDTTLHLQQGFTRCYEQGGFMAKIDYEKDPPQVLKDEDRRWVRQLLKQKKTR
jgi:hypothetical protein